MRIATWNINGIKARLGLLLQWLEQVKPDFNTGDAVPNTPVDQRQVDDATAYYQVAASMFKHGQLVKRPDDSKPVN